MTIDILSVHPSRKPLGSLPSQKELGKLVYMTSELQQFVKEALEKGVSRDAIEKTLLRADWLPDEVKNALTLYADIDFPIAVPRRKPYLSAREAFLYLVLFLTLYISAFSNSLIRFINRYLPDAPILIFPDVSTQSIKRHRFLIITFPVSLFQPS